MLETTPSISAKDREILRRLSQRIAEIGHSDAMEEKRRQWRKLNRCEGERPMIIVEAYGVGDELYSTFTYECEGNCARGYEHGLLARLYQHEVIGDDTIIEPRMTYGHVVHATNYGVEAVKHKGDDGEGHGSYCWEPALKSLDEVDKLRCRTFTYDREATEKSRAGLEEVFGDVLPVVNKSWHFWTQGLTIVAIDLIGLEEFMMAMYDDPAGLHRLMTFLRDDHMQALDWYEQAGVLSINNEDEYIGSGGCGYTDLLPQPDYIPGSPVRCKDMWGLSESQETVSVSPEQFAEFVFPYQVPMISRFGLAYYGCCEPVDQRWHIINQLPNLHAVSVSPWSNVEVMAERLGNKYVFCRKPNPAYVSTSWEEDVIRQDLRQTIEATKGMSVQLILKDVHTVAKEPWRFKRWVDIAREEIDRVYGR